MIASASSGIEPIFALVYTKTVMDGVELVEVNNFFKNALQKEGIYSEELVKKVAQNKGSVQNMTEIPEHIQKIFVTAGDITPEWHIKMQAALQKNTDNAISKTINFPFEATISDVEESYKLAWHLKTKGLTVYRDGSRQVQVLTTGTKDKEKLEEKTEEIQTVVATGIRIIPRERPDVIHGSTYRMKTAYGKLFVTINDDEEGMPFEMFSTLGKTGGFFASNTEAICRLISLALRAGIDPQEVIDQIKGIRGPQPTWGEDGKMILSLPDAIGQLLERHMTREQPNLNLNFNIAVPKKISEEEVAQNMESINALAPTVKEHSRNLADSGEAPACPECSAMLEFTEGCLKCTSCGYSKCS
jgi:ribonucleoside-diphosphate reductase alpha chain